MIQPQDTRLVAIEAQTLNAWDQRTTDEILWSMCRRLARQGAAFEAYKVTELPAAHARHYAVWGWRPVDAGDFEESWQNV